MQKKLIAAALSTTLAATTAFGGSLVEPEMEPMTEVMEEEPASSTGGLLVPLLALVAIGLLISQDSDEEQPQPSDIRVKRDIERVGTAQNGLPLYNYKYLWSNKTYQGVMAQDVLAHNPEAVVRGPLGLLTVKYAELGLEMKRVH